MPIYCDDSELIPAVEESTLKPQIANEKAKEKYEDYLAHSFEHADLPKVDVSRYVNRGTEPVSGDVMNVRFAANALETSELFICNENGKSFFDTLKHANGEPAERYEISAGLVEVEVNTATGEIGSFDLTPIFCPHTDEALNDESQWELGETITLKDDVSLNRNLDMLRVIALQRAERWKCHLAGKTPEEFPKWATKPYYLREIENVAVLGYSPKLVWEGGRIGYVDPSLPPHMMSVEETRMFREIGPGNRESSFIR